MSRRDTLESILKESLADALPEALADADPNTRRYVHHLARREQLAPEVLWARLRSERTEARNARDSVAAAERIALEVRARR